jgi:hypothetical protein
LPPTMRTSAWAGLAFLISATVVTFHFSVG